MKINKLIKVFYYIFGAVIILIGALLVISSFPITGNYKVMIVQSGSMEPTIGTGSIVVVKPVDNYGQNDVITFKTNSRSDIPTTHRIVDVKIQNDQEVYMTKGDANNAPDIREVNKKDVIGKVFFDVPWVGYLLASAKKPIGFVILIIIPALLIIVDEARKIILELKKIRNK